MEIFICFLNLFIIGKNTNIDITCVSFMFDHKKLLKVK